MSIEEFVCRQGITVAETLTPMVAASVTSGLVALGIMAAPVAAGVVLAATITSWIVIGMDAGGVFDKYVFDKFPKP